MKPTVGRIVHYNSYGTPNGEYMPETRAALITAVLGVDEVSLCIINPTGLFFNERAYYSEEPRPGFWNWPPRT